MMEKDVYVRIGGRQFADGEWHEIDPIIVPGSYYQKNDAQYILYETTESDSSLVTKNRLKIKSGTIELTKSGAVSTRMVFSQGQCMHTQYATPYGPFAMQLDTTSVRINEEDHRLRIDLAYDLSINGAHAANCELWIRIDAATCIEME